MKKESVITLAVIATALTLCSSGCSWNKVVMKSETPVLIKEGTNTFFAIKTQQTSTTTKNFFDSKQTIDQQKIGNGATQTIGQNGMSQEGSATNIVSGIEKGGVFVGNVLKTIITQ